MASAAELRGVLKVLETLNSGNSYYYGDGDTRRLLSQLRDRMRVLTKPPKTKVLSNTDILEKCGLRKLRKLRTATCGTMHHCIDSARPGQKMMIMPPPPPPPHTETKIPLLPKHVRCYDCRAMMNRVHSFYDQMCVSCGDRNYVKRMQQVPLHDGQVSLVTGARVKIGYHIALKLLRAPNGGEVIITTRFPNDAAARYSLEEDYDQWQHKLVIVGLDFRDVSSVERFGRWVVSTFDRLDILINNAAQTIRRPPAYYEHLMKNELSKECVWSTVRSLGTVSACMSQVPMMSSDKLLTFDRHTLFPPGSYDADGQQLDERHKTSWCAKLGDVSTVELMETLCINSAAPFILMRVLKPLMAGSKQPTYVINVSSMEGDFNRSSKLVTHPHTNGAKAFLDMITRTSAADYVTSKIFMNSVDTGWVTIETPRAHHTRMVPPIDEMDGAARVLDPIVSALTTGNHPYGKYYKDYRTRETMIPDT